MAIDIHISLDDIFDGWTFEHDTKETSVGRIAPWGGHYILIIHDDVPDDVKEDVAQFIANAPSVIKKLTAQTQREGELILIMKEQISFYKAKVNRLTQKLESKNRKK